jgi:NAD(P)-dependent dehydrogenase (short-subunit alcohol dehydrogenase family)
MDSQTLRTYQAPTAALAGRVILVTGAGDGIGKAVSLSLARHGATVVLLGKTLRKLEKVHDEILAAGWPAPAMAHLNLETALAPEYDALVSSLQAEYGRLDGLLHNAAILGTLAPVELYDVPTFGRVMHVNVTAAFALTHVCLPLLKASEDASIVFTTSSVGRKGRAYWGAYAASKFAVEGLAQVLADELSTDGRVRVNCLNPGATRTAMRSQAFPGENRERLPLPETIVAPYLFLLGPAARGVTGASFDCQEPAKPA